MKKLNIGILGLGNVAIGTIEILRENFNYISKKTNTEIVIKKVLVSDINKKRNIDIDKNFLTVNPDDILDDEDISVVIELIGGLEPAFSYIKKAMENKKHVISANKFCIAEKMDEIFDIAKENNVMFKFEASVAGGIPIINGIQTSLNANKIESILGIINGTTNFILTKMTNEGKDFDDILVEAQKCGFAEADPTSDVENFDAKYKLKILSKLAFGYNPKDIYAEGITTIESEDIIYAKECGYVIKSLAIANVIDKKIELRVAPCMIKESHPLANVSDAFNALFVNGNAVGELMFYGRGAGSLPTGSAVVSDLIYVANNFDRDDVSVETEAIVDRKLLPVDIEDQETNFYIRLSVIDKPGMLAIVVGGLSKMGISIQSISQRETIDNGFKSLVIFTDKVKYKQMNGFLEELKKDKAAEIKNVFSVI